MNSGVVASMSDLAASFRRRAELLLAPGKPSSPRDRHEAFVWNCAAEDLERALKPFTQRKKRGPTLKDVLAAQVSLEETV